MAFMGTLVSAGAEGLLARSREHDCANRFLPASALERGDQFLDRLAAECVVLIRAVDGDMGDTVALFIENVFVRLAHELLPGLHRSCGTVADRRFGITTIARGLPSANAGARGTHRVIIHHLMANSSGIDHVDTLT